MSIIKDKGTVNDDIDFEYGEETDAFYGCGTTLFGQFWYFGGSESTLRQVTGFRSGIVLIIFI